MRCEAATSARLTFLPLRRRFSHRAAEASVPAPARAPALRLLRRWLDTWAGLGLVVVGVERQGLRFSLSHIAEGEWRASFMARATFIAHPLFAPAGFGGAKTPWRTVQRPSTTSRSR